MAEGGPPPGNPQPIAGTVTIRGAGRTYQLTVGIDGRFLATLPPGRYTVTGRGPGDPSGPDWCLGGPVVLAAGDNVTANVTCDLT
jgi:hypothetical protein